MQNRKKKKYIVVEAFGTPGVGKSYICKELENSLTTKGFSVKRHYIDDYHPNWMIRSISKFVFIVGQVSINIKVFNHSVRIVRCFTGITGLDRVRLLVNILLISSAIVSHRKAKSTLLLDQGIFQAVWSLFYANTDVDDSIDSSKLVTTLTELLKSLSIEVLLVLAVRADDSQVVHRLQTRRVKGSSRLNNLGEGALMKANLATAKTREIIENVATRSQNVVLVNIAN